MRKKFYPEEKGFTLLEVILVLLLLGLLYSIIMGEGWNVGALDLQKKARHLATDLRWARFRAIQTGKEHYINLELEQNRYWISQKKGEKIVELMERELGDGVELVDFSLAQPVFHFSLTGAPSRGNTITLGDEKGQARVITRVGTGRVRVSIESKEG